MPPANPYDRHTCADDPLGFALGFDRAANWVQTASPHRAAQVHRAIATSDNRYWTTTAAQIGFPADAYWEGLALGIYGIKALEGISGEN